MVYKMSTVTKISALVRTHWLREKMNLLSTTKGLEKTTASLRILDTSWVPEPDVDGYTQFYKQGHIPTAGYFDLRKITPKQTSVELPMPDSNVFQDYAEELGVSSDTHVIAYDRLNTRSSFRTWFMFRLFGHDKVSVLSGGLRQWIKDGYDVTTDEPVFSPGTFKVTYRDHLLHQYADMVKNVDSKGKQIMDSRPADSFFNKSGNAGHLPGSKSIPFTALFNDDGTVKSEKDLQELFNQAGVDLNKPVVSSCQRGMTACGLIAAAHLLGVEDVPLYNGSWHEWGALAEESRIVR